MSRRERYPGVAIPDDVYSGEPLEVADVTTETRQTIRQDPPTATIATADGTVVAVIGLPRWPVHPVEWDQIQGEINGSPSFWDVELMLTVAHADVVLDIIELPDRPVHGVEWDLIQRRINGALLAMPEQFPENRP